MNDLYQEMMCHGFCNILAQELNSELGLPLRAAIDYDYDLEEDVLVHMWNVLPNGQYYDAQGIIPKNLTRYLSENYEELDKFRLIKHTQDVMMLINDWKTYLPLPSKNDYLQSAGNPKEAQQYLQYHIETVKGLINENT